MAASQDEGRGLLAVYEPDWLIVACELLHRSGREFMRWVRSGRPETRVAILAETVVPAEFAYARRLTPDAIYRKPVDAEALFRGCALAREPKAVG